MNKNLLLRHSTPLGTADGLSRDLARSCDGGIQASSEDDGKQAHRKAAIDTALRYAEAIAKGDKITTGQLDFACQYRLLTMQSAGLPNPRATEAFVCRIVGRN